MKVEAKPGSWKALQHMKEPDSVMLMAEEEWVLPKLKALNPAVGDIDVDHERQYPYHAVISKQGYAQIMFSLAMDLDYTEHNKMIHDEWPESDELDPEDPDDAELDDEAPDEDPEPDGDPEE